MKKSHVILKIITLFHYIKLQRWTKKGKDPSNVIKQKQKFKFQQTKDTFLKLNIPKKIKYNNFLIQKY